MKIANHFLYLFLVFMMISCNTKPELLHAEVYETSASGNKLTRISDFVSADSLVSITLLPEKKFQTITGFGGSFTEASASLLNRLSKKNRDKIWLKLKSRFQKSRFCTISNTPTISNISTTSNIPTISISSVIWMISSVWMIPSVWMIFFQEIGS